MKKVLLTIFILAAVVSGGTLVWHSSRVQSWWQERQKADLPNPEPLVEIPIPNVNITNASTNENSNTILVFDLPAEKNLAVPFTSQAPHAKWGQDHDEFCEEAAVLMTGRYFQHRGISSADDAEAALQEIKAWELKSLGYYFDTTAAETAKILRDLYPVNVVLVENPTIDQIRTAIGNGKLVIVPAAGRELGNPNFRSPGPIYHNLVIRGYTDDGKFITNDPGTRKGEEYVYQSQVVMDAMHDWVPRKPRTTAGNGSPTGTPTILVVSAK